MFKISLFAFEIEFEISLIPKRINTVSVQLSRLSLRNEVVAWMWLPGSCAVEFFHYLRTHLIP